jgi:hypothetical protein
LVRLGRVSAEIHFGSAPPDYGQLLSLLSRIRQLVPSAAQQRLRLVVAGPIDDLDCDVLEELMRTRVVLMCLAGWWHNCTDTSWTQLPSPGVRRIAEFGYRLPVVWNLHQGNIEHLDRLLSDSLKLNYDSGVVLCPAAYSPYYDFGSTCPSLPTVAAYCDAMTRFYLAYPQYDDLSCTVTELCHTAAASRKGDLNINLCLTNEGVCVFRQIPAAGILFAPLTEMEGFEARTFLDNLLAANRELHNSFLQELCYSCKWKQVCGGVDAVPTDNESMVRAQSLVCSFRMLFSEHFSSTFGTMASPGTAAAH